jgi:hypothetical protein
MAGASDIYTDEVHRQLRYMAAWPPGQPLSLGAVGEVRDGVFTYRSHLNEKSVGIPYEETTEDTPDEKWVLQSKGGVSINFKTAGESGQEGAFAHIGSAEAGAAVRFSREKAVLLSLRKARVRSIRDQIDLKRKLQEAYASGKLDKNLIVITEIVDAESGTVLISNSNSAATEIKAEGDFKREVVDLGNAELRLQTAYSKDMQTELIAKEGLTPFYKALRLKGRFLRSDQVGPLEVTAPEDVARVDAEELFEVVSPEGSGGDPRS